MPTPAELLERWLAERLDVAPLEWLRTSIAAARAAGLSPAFLVAFGSAPRRVGKEPLALDEDDRRAALSARPAWAPGSWTRDQAARTLLILALPSGDPRGYVATLDRLFDDADLGELVALYQALPLLPHPELHRSRAAEGVRANMQPVFEAVALRNPYPAEQLDENAFNQLVLKCLFIGSRLSEVSGLDARANLTLARMLGDTARERWAAGRPVSPELWRVVGPFAEGPLLDDLERVLTSGTDRERAAIALATRGNASARPVLARHGAALASAAGLFPSWDAIVGP